MYTPSLRLFMRQVTSNTFSCLCQGVFLFLPCFHCVFSLRWYLWRENRVIVTYLSYLSNDLKPTLDQQHLKFQSNFLKRMERNENTHHRNKHGKSRLWKMSSIFFITFYFSFHFKTYSKLLLLIYFFGI